MKRWQIASLLLLAGFLFYSRKSIIGMTRGLINNNPLNLRYNASIKWDGQTGKDANGFAQFISMAKGLRAGVMTIRNKQKLHGLKTIREIITQFAPPSENDTEAYIKLVTRENNIKDNQIIDLVNNDGLLAGIVRSMIKMEQGINPISNEMVNTAIAQTRVVA